MTTLDPHDFEQKSLDVDIAKLVQLLVKAAGLVTSVIPPLAAAINFLGKGLPTLLKVADYLGVELDPAPFSDFKDPRQLARKLIDHNGTLFVLSGTAAATGAKVH